MHFNKSEKILKKQQILVFPFFNPNINEITPKCLQAEHME